MATLNDAVIETLLKEPKPLPSGFRDTLLHNMKEEGTHKRSQLSVTGTDGDNFVIMVRMNKLNLLDFSVILGYELRDTTGLFLLRRYNGKSHEHTNQIERDRFRDFHIHTATERYQIRGDKEEAYAVPTERYSDLGGALNCMIADCGFILPSGEPTPLL